MNTLIRHLSNMIGTLPNHTKRNWQEWLSTLVSAYSSTISNAMDFSPYYRMYGHQPQLPIDIAFGVMQVNISGSTHENYAQRLKARLKWAYKATKEVNAKELKRHKQYFDQKFHSMALAPGDVVQVRVKAFGQDHKIAQWEQNPHIVLSQMGDQQNPHIVLSQMGDQPIFKVQPKDAKDQKGIRILCWNMLYSIQSAQNGAQDTTDQSPAISMTALLRLICWWIFILVILIGREGDWYGD